MINHILRKIMMWVFLVFASGYLTSYLFNRGQLPVEEISFSQFLKAVESGQVSEVKLRGNDASIKLKDGSAKSSRIMVYDGLMKEIKKNNVDLKFIVQDTLSSIALTVLLSVLPVLIFFLFSLFTLRQLQVTAIKPGGFGKSTDKRFKVEGNAPVTFDDVAGIEEAKEDMLEIVDFLRRPDRYAEVGAAVPKGILFVGPPGTGKTLMARAIAGEAGVPFFSISASEFVEMFVGVGASRVRDLFEKAKSSAPALIFIDELDAVGRSRGGSTGGGNDERENTLNQLLVEMDGFEGNSGVIVIAATNRIDVLDKALLRPGRFDRKINIPLPDMNGRLAVLKVQVRTKKAILAADVDLGIIARATPGFSGAEIANLINEAAIRAVRLDKASIQMEDLGYARDRIIMGKERVSLAMRDSERKITAYHEAGHAIIGTLIETSDPVYKVTIVPRGFALGMVVSIPEYDKLSISKEALLGDLSMILAGKAAEEVIFGHAKVTTGPSSDIVKATEIARRMVCAWGMSDKLGPVYYMPDEEEFRIKPSHDTARIIDAEIKSILENAYERAKKILTENRKALEDVVEALIEFETVTGEEIREIIKGKKLTRSLPPEVQETPDNAAKESIFKLPEE